MLGDRMDDLPLALGRKRIGCPLLAPWTCELGKWIESPDSARVVSLRGSEHGKLDAMPGFIDSYWFHQILAADFSRFGQVRQGRHSEIPYCFVDILFCRLEWLDRQSFCGKVDPTGADFLSSLPKLAKLAVSRFQKLGPKHSPMAWFWQQLHHFSEEAKTPAPGKNMTVILSGMNPGGFLWISGDFLEYWTCPSRPPCPSLPPNNGQQFNTDSTSTSVPKLLKVRAQ